MYVQYYTVNCSKADPMKRCTAERDKTLNDLCSQPKKETDIATVQEKEINIDNFKNFHAKRRWKVSQ